MPFFPMRLSANNRLRLATGGIAAGGFYWSLAAFPRPAMLLIEHGPGYQLAGGAEILAGRHPFIDFQDIYGPLTFYASAAAQWLCGGGLLGELLLTSVSAAAAYALLFRLMVACDVCVRPAVVMTAVAITVGPEPYRYYLLLLPLVFFWTAWRYAAQPGGWRLSGVALSVTVAGLFRPDLGVFTGISAAVLVLAGGGGARPILRRLAALAGLILVFSSPWLGWLASHGKLTAYLVNSSLDSMQTAIGLAKPAPPFDFSHGWVTVQNAKAYLFRLPLLTTLAIGAVFVVRRAELRGPKRAQLLCAGAFLVLSLAQASHIVDWFHVRDTLPVRLLLLAWCATAVGSIAAVRARRALVAVFCLSMVAGVMGKAELDQRSPWKVGEKIFAYAKSRREVLTAVQQDAAHDQAALYDYVRDHSGANEKVLAVLEAPQLNFFSERGFAGRQMAILPGYFASADHQRELIGSIRRGPTAFIVIHHLVMMDQPEHALDRFAPEFYAFLQAEFVEVKRFGGCRVLTPRWRPGAPLDAPDWWTP